MTRLERLTERKTRVTARLTEEQAKDAPRAEKVTRLTARVATIQGKIDAI